MLIFVFDPMAVMFIVSYNVVLEHSTTDSKQVVKKKKDVEKIEEKQDPSEPEIPKSDQ